MQALSKIFLLTAAGAVGIALLGVKHASGQGAEPKPQMAEDVFKNVQALRGIPPDQFMGTMGAFSAALGMSCEDCHVSGNQDWSTYATDTPLKIRTRQMVLMMTAINKQYFGGRQGVTCYSCHRGANHPKVTPNLATLYDPTPIDNPDDTIQPAPGQLPADQILDKYIQALGGAQKLLGITSFVAKGTNSGYGPEGGKRAVEIYAKAPNQRTTVIQTDNGVSTTAFDGRSGWYAAPLRPIPVLTYNGADLAVLKLEAEMAFPGRIKQILGNLKVGFPVAIGDKDYTVVQGTSQAGTLTTLYFDPDTGLLARMVRYANSVVGRFPTLIDYSDYRDVAGVKMPYHWVTSWLDGKETYDITDFQVNVAIDAARFAKPAPPPSK